MFDREEKQIPQQNHTENIGATTKNGIFLSKNRIETTFL